MPELARLAVLLLIHLVLELGVAAAVLAVERGLVRECAEVKGLAGGPDDYLLAEVAVLRVVQTVLDEVAHQHLDTARAVGSCSQAIRGDEGIFLVFCGPVLGEVIGSLLPVALCPALLNLAGLVAPTWCAAVQSPGRTDMT